MASTPMQIKGVRAACTAGAAKHHIKEFVTYDLHANHVIFTHGAVSELSLLIGMPLLVMKSGPSFVQPAKNSNPDNFMNGKLKVSSLEHEQYFPNVTATTLMFRCADAIAAAATGAANIEVIQHLQAPPEWTTRVGNILIARRDRKPLYALHVVAVLAFIYRVVEDASMSEKAELVERFTPQAFREFYDGAMEELASSLSPGTPIKTPSPFDSIANDGKTEEAEASSASWSMALRDW